MKQPDDINHFVSIVKFLEKLPKSITVNGVEVMSQANKTMYRP